jgi:hypothetical protein
LRGGFERSFPRILLSSVEIGIHELLYGECVYCWA